MKAMILCAGYGSRLGELTRDTPKPLLRAGGFALVEYTLANLRNHGCLDILINLHHHADQICSVLESWAGRGVAITYSHEESLLGTAGALKNVESFFAQEDAFLVHYGDVVTDVDITKMLEFHRERNAAATLLVHTRQKSNSALSFDENYCVQQFVERPPEGFWETVGTTWVNSGVLILSPSVMALIPASVPSDWPRDIFPQLIQSQSLYAYCLDAYRIAVDSPERLAQLETDIQTGKFTRAGLWRSEMERVEGIEPS
jgi:NDP-sugar pyrophosphorylase family protein